MMSADVVKELKESGKTLREILTDHNLLQLLYERHTLDEVMASVAESLNRSHDGAHADNDSSQPVAAAGTEDSTLGENQTLSTSELDKIK